MAHLFIQKYMNKQFDLEHSNRRYIFALSTLLLFISSEPYVNGLQPGDPRIMVLEAIVEAPPYTTEGIVIHNNMHLQNSRIYLIYTFLKVFNSKSFI